ncbi:MAG TPA: hypothetical protein VLV18_06350 [Terriglobales bacterium]|nr:hypothetical protein [Terriglobales bacterium]
MSATELNNLLDLADSIDTRLTTVLTINARHQFAMNLTAEYAEVMQAYRNVGLCFVAGNPAYLTSEERRLDIKSRITDLVKMSRVGLPDAEIFVGSEGLDGTSSELAAEYSTIPFMLLGPQVHDQAADFLQDTAVSAVYCPCNMSATNDADLVKALGSYALRRKWVRRSLRREGFNVPEVTSTVASGAYPADGAGKVLASAIRELALCDHDQTRNMLQRFSSNGIKYAAVLLAEENKAQSQILSRLADYAS